jgi:hypothetical protein
MVLKCQKKEKSHSPASQEKRKKKENPSNSDLWKYKDRKHYRSACPEVGNKWVPLR